jgi:amino acid transporter
MAMVALVFSEYLFKAISPDQDVSTWILKGTALLAIASITYLNCTSTRVGTGAANFFLVLKVFGLGSIAIAGLTFALNGFTNRNDNDQSNGAEQGSFTALLPVAPHPGELWLWMSLGNFTDAVLAALFAYGGWESVSERQIHVKSRLRHFRLVL